MGRGSGQPGGHHHRFGIDGEMGQRALPEREDRLVWISISPVPAESVFNGPAGERVLQPERRLEERNAQRAAVAFETVTPGGERAV